MYFSGKVSRIIFDKRAMGYYILSMLLDGATGGDSVGAKLVVVRGYVPGLQLQVGSWFGFEAKWSEHADYGRQLEISRAPIFKGRMDPDTVAKLLESNGVPAMVAFELKRAFGQDMSEFLKDSKHVQEALAVSSLEADFLVSMWRSICAQLSTLEMVSGLGLPKGKVNEIWATFGSRTEEMLATNPWELLCIDGISFTVMDDIARTAGLSLECSERQDAAVVFACRKGKGHGDLYLTFNQVISAMQMVDSSLTPQQIADSVKRCHRNGVLTVDKTTRSGVTAVYDPWSLEMEEESAQALYRRVRDAQHDSSDLDRLSAVGEGTEQVICSGGTLEEIAKSAVRECARTLGYELPLEQAEGVTNGLLHPVSILTGLPGTGKSTSMRVLVEILRQSGVSYLLVAPTGIAAKRLGSVCSTQAFTIHRALAAKGFGEDEKREASYAGITGNSKSLIETGRDSVWECNPATPHGASVIIMDECSMIDQHLLFRLLQGTSPTSRLILVGDAAQLPSVGPGNVLRDLINSGLFPVVSLTQIHRQAETSSIVPAAHAIHRGEVPNVNKDTDFVLIHVKTEEDIQQTILKLATRLYQVADTWDKEKGGVPTFQVLSPRHKGTLGVTNLNSTLRETLNPRSDGLLEIKMGGEIVRERDRVMVVKNNYDLNVYNGDIGTVTEIDRPGKRVRVKVHGEYPMVVTFSLTQAEDHLRLAYACTVHKYQGLEVGTVIIPIVLGFGRQLQRNLYYTAVTRARKKVILVGHPYALEKAVANNKEDLRNTLFVDRIRNVFAASRPSLPKGLLAFPATEESPFE